MKDEDILTEYIKGLNLDPEDKEVRIMVSGISAFKWYVLGVRWTELKQSITDQVNKLL